MNLWIYTLPGTHLEGLRSAGAPALEELAALADDHRYGLLGEESSHWRCWILYGPPHQALSELCHPLDERYQTQALARWTQQLMLAAQVKRRWRQRVMLMNLAGQVSGSEPSAALTALERELPELELRARLERSSAGASLPDGLTQMAALCLMQSDPALLQAYLDLEHWADHPSTTEDQAFWRTPPSHTFILKALSTAGQWESSAAQGKAKIDELTRELQLLKDERKLTNQSIVQLEAELEHYVHEHINLNAITSQLEAQLLRARQFIQSRLGL